MRDVVHAGCGCRGRGGQRIGDVDDQRSAGRLLRFFAVLGDIQLVRHHGLPKPASSRPCTSTISSGLQAALNSATGGAVICLNSGSYGNISLRLKVLLVGRDGSARDERGCGTCHIDFTSVGNLHISGNGGGGATMSVVGHDVDGSSLNLTLDYLTVNGCSGVSNPGFNNVLFDHNRYDNIAGCTYGAASRC